jgi:predicted murein hydrolase (TIGR00659 family)
MTPEPVRSLWVYLGASPLLWLALTLGVYAAALRLQRALGGSPWANPVGLSVAALVALLATTGTPYGTYFDGAQFVHFLLGTATVAIAIPLRRQWNEVRAAIGPTTLTLLFGNVAGAMIAMAVLRAWGAPRELIASIAPKGVTAPVAMAVAERTGGLPSLTAVLVIASGILGATMATPLLNALRVRDWAARGLAVGMTAHGIGTARAFQVDPLAGTFAGVAMAVSTLLTSALVPWLLPLFT